jgi:3-mercaptopropionate dioxygenase
VERAIQTLIPAQLASGEFDPELFNLKTNLSAWIAAGLAAPSQRKGLARLCEELERAMSRGSIALPERFCEIDTEHYARRLVYEDRASGVMVLAMVWAPGQGTPLHDHAGLWGIEAVLCGEIESVPYHMFAQQNGEYYFNAQPAERLAAGSTGYLLPPFEHHVTRNVSEEVAITLNIYGGPMPACHIFLPTGFGAYTRQRRALSFE